MRKVFDMRLTPPGPTPKRSSARSVMGARESHPRAEPKLPAQKMASIVKRSGTGRYVACAPRAGGAAGICAAARSAALPKGRLLEEVLLADSERCLSSESDGGLPPLWYPPAALICRSPRGLPAASTPGGGSLAR